MISITAEMGRDSVFSLTAEGHAGADRNEDGRDLVCCAVSTIFGTLANSCAQIDDVNTVYHSRHGYAHCVVTNIPDDLWAEINSRYQMAVDGLEALAMQYTQCLHVSVEN